MKASELMEWNLCAEVKDGFERLAEAAERVATREAGEEVGSLVPEGLSRLAEKAAAYAAKHNPFVAVVRFSDPLAKLGAIVERVRDLGTPQARREEAVGLAMECAVLAAVAGMRVERLFLAAEAKARIAELEARAAEAEARAAEAEAEMYNAQGEAEAEAEARKRAEEERSRAEEAWRKEAEARAAAEALAKERGRILDGKRAGVPAMLAEAQDARENPEEAAAEVLRFVQAELQGRAGELWTAWKECGHSLNAAAKKAGIAETTARRIFAMEIVPFYQKHNWTLPKESGWGRKKRRRMKDGQLDTELYHGHGHPLA